MDESRYSRNIALFGEEGQRKIAATAVAVVGLGGLGSHVAQQLAYLG
jgi:molybdopterin/thiamine biosynthesis adenylyltransferase